jgi:hypothetical protein
MPGNVTIYKSGRGYFTGDWTKKDVAQNTSGTIKYFGDVEILALPTKSSVVSMTVNLSAALTAGWLDLKITRDGALVGKKVRMEPADGVSQTKQFKPGEVVVGIAKQLGVDWVADAAMLPTGSVDVVVSFEVEPR